MSVLSDNGQEGYGMQPVEVLNVSYNLTSPAPSLEKIKALQSVIAGLPQIDVTPNHYFADGMYGRELAIPAGNVVVGKTHRHEHLVLLTKGTVTINTDKGMETISAPHTWVSQPGAKRVLYTHDDCVFFTVHLNHENSRDLEQIEAYVIEPEGLIEQSEFSNELQRAYA